MPLSNPSYAATSVGPTATGSRDVSWVACASCARQDGRQAVWRLAGGQGSRAIRQAHVPGEHGVSSPKVRVMVLQSWHDPHLVVVAAFQNHHGD